MPGTHLASLAIFVLSFLQCVAVADFTGSTIIPLLIFLPFFSEAKVTKTTQD